MQLRQLQTLVAIADTGSFHAAAAKLGLTQAAVSMQMKSLEQSLRLELFERSVRPPRLNNTGLLMLEQARLEGGGGPAQIRTSPAVQRETSLRLATPKQQA